MTKSRQFCDRAIMARPLRHSRAELCTNSRVGRPARQVTTLGLTFVKKKKAREVAPTAR